MFIGLLIALSCCSKKPPEPLIDPTVQTVNDILYAADNVSVWEASTTADVTITYTSLDTTATPASIDWPISALYAEGDSVRFSWVTTNFPALIKVEKRWVAGLQKWQATSTLIIDPNTTPAQLLLNASVTFLKENKAISRKALLFFRTQTATFDLFRVNFGMSKDEVKANELSRLGLGNTGTGVWYEPSPSLGVLSKSSHLAGGGYTLYAFDNGKLKTVSETAAQETLTEPLRRLAVELKIPESITNGPLTKEYVWNNGKLKFSLTSKEIDLGSGVKKYVLLTYEKA
ncbi:hypothetical protein GCM10028773_20650 [Spirosoma koreense]